MSVPLHEQQAKRLLRQQIGRLRRRIDRRVRGVRQQGQQLASWRSYFLQHPGLTMLAIVGLGLATAFGMTRCQWGDHPAVERIKQFLRSTLEWLRREAKQRWTGTTTPEHTASAQGGPHAQT